MKHYGLIGRKLEHSWSAEYFSKRFAADGTDAEYRLYELADISEVRGLKLDGYNVTIPYKEAIIPYLKELDELAREIGAVNVVKEGKGYNTDWMGVTAALLEVRPLRCWKLDDRALILGQGGAAKAVRYALEQMGIEATMVSARGKVESDVGKYRLIVNATPLGMYPNVESYPDIAYEELGKDHVLFDCVYNPVETEFLRRGRMKGAKTINGKRMLEVQAEESYLIFDI